MSLQHRVLLVRPSGEEGAVGLCPSGFQVDLVRNGRQCLVMLDERDYDALITELNLPDLPAPELLEHARRRSPEIVVVAYSTNGNPQEVVRLAKLGLDDYVPASVPADIMAERLEELIRHRRPRPAEPAASLGSPLIGQSRAMRMVMETIRMIAARRSTVLITGPTGTGKELVARLIHSLSPRKMKPMVTVNCSAIPEQLLEAEFFGHVKGAFTGAVSARVGYFEQADGATLFLDEIGDMPLGLQAKVLRAIQEREFQRVGSTDIIKVDTRIIAATNCDLAEKVRKGAFREDLYYRLNVVPVELPPLVDRIEDLESLVAHFVEKVCRHEGLPRKRVSPETLSRLRQYHWPGNVRQLENAVEKAVVLSGDRTELYPSDFPIPAPEPKPMDGAASEWSLPPGGMDLDATLTNLERHLLEQALERTGGNKAKAAELLGLKRTTLSAKLKAAGSKE